MRKDKNIIYIDGNTLRLYKNSLEIYTAPHKYFLGEDEQRATALSFNYWNNFFTRIQNKFNIIIIKGENTRILQVNAHYSEINNELADELNVKKIKLNIFAKEDGKIWFKIDNSFRLNEVECIHPNSAKQDMGIIKAFFNDLRNNIPPTLSELSSIVVKNTQSIRGLLMYQAYFAENIKTHIQAIQTLGKSVEKLSEIMERKT